MSTNTNNTTNTTNIVSTLSAPLETFVPILLRKKTETEHLWDIELKEDESVIGFAKAYYKTKTQRWWDGEVVYKGTTYSAEGIFSIKQLMANLEAQLYAASAITPTTVPATKTPATIVTKTPATIVTKTPAITITEKTTSESLTESNNEVKVEEQV